MLKKYTVLVLRTKREYCSCDQKLLFSSPLCFCMQYTIHGVQGVKLHTVLRSKQSQVPLTVKLIA